MRNFEAHNDEIRKQMLEVTGVKSVDELFSKIPKSCATGALNIGNPLSELEAAKKLEKLSKKNKTDYLCFKGGGAYKRFIPACIPAIAQRFEFLSAYTPYQAEISQGSLQVMYEFQSMMCTLTGMDVSNASVYDGATACAEAILMAIRISKIKSAFVSSKVNPNYIEVIKTYLWAQDIELVIGENIPSGKEFGAILYQFPDYYGELYDFNNIKKPNEKALTVACVDLFTLANIEPPKSDIVVGDIQTLGLPLSFGGPYGGFIATKDAYKRQLPGRIAGKTTDREGKDAYVLTLQAREQHIRREKATGNICSNQALCALMVTVYLSVMGKSGLKEASIVSYKNAHTLACGLKENGFKILNNEFYAEFTAKLPENTNADDFLSKMKEKNILAGIKLDNSKILIAASEYLDDCDIKSYISAAKNILN